MENKKSAGGKRPGLIVLMVCICVMMFEYAISTTILGPLVPTLIDQFGISLSESGLLPLARGVAGVIFALMGVFFVERFKKTSLIKTLYLVFTGGIAAIAIVPTYGLIIASFFVVGGCAKLIDILLSSFVSDTYSERRSIFINLIHTFFGVGSVVGPLIPPAFLSAGLDWRLLFAIFAAITLLTLIAFIIAARGVPEEKKEARTFDAAEFLSVLKNRRVIVLSLLPMLFSAFVVSAASWIPTYLTDRLGTTVEVSALPVSALWIGTILSRLGYSLFGHRFEVRRVIIAAATAAGALLIAASAINQPGFYIAAYGVAGVLIGLTYPAAVFIACSWYPQASGTVTSVVMLYTAVGIMVVPWLLGIVAEGVSFFAGILVMNLLPLLIAASTLFIAPVQKAQKTDAGAA